MLAKYEIHQTKTVFVYYRKSYTQPPYTDHVWFSFSRLAPLKTRDVLLKEFQAMWPVTAEYLTTSGNGLLDLILDCFQIARDELIDKGMIQEEQT